MRCNISLYESLSDKKIVIAGDPDLLDIQVHPDGDAQFIFSITDITLDNDERWKRLTLKAPERKNYLDLDRQVELVIKEEQELRAKYIDPGISKGDWIHFDIAIIDKNNQFLLHDYKSSVWLRMSSEESDKALHDIFLGKKVGDSFLTQSPYFQEYVSFVTDMSYTFQIDIKDYLPGSYFNFDLLCHHFGLKVSKKCIKSSLKYILLGNDISLRQKR